MNLAEFAQPLGAFIGFILTLMVISYVVGDNFLFRLAVHIFIGVAAGYATVVVIYNVIWYQLIVPLIPPSSGQMSVIIPALLFGVWLLTKVSPRLSHLGNPMMAFLVGVGAAVAIGGAITGTIFPQVQASVNTLNIDASQQTPGSLVRWLFNGIIILAGTVCTLVYFNFGTRPNVPQSTDRLPLIQMARQAGLVFITITFGVLFAGVYAATLAAFVERVFFAWNFIWDLINRFIS